MKGAWGNWHKGDRYDIRLGKVYFYDQAGYHTRVDVEIFDKATGKTHYRVGDGRQIGNFHPVWVNWRGRKIQLEHLLEQR